MRISTNSWGTDGDYAQYTDYSAALDAYVVSHPDMVLLFAASNDGSGNRFASLSSSAAAKNVIAVGALQDGFLAHSAKIGGEVDAALGTIPPLFGGFDGRSCRSVLEHASVYALLCPATAPTPAPCASMALRWLGGGGAGVWPGLHWEWLQ